jgi:maltose O-acetyltransferase
MFLFKAVIPNAGTKLSIEPPFYCDYNIITEENVYMNFNCYILDVSTGTIGDNCMFEHNVQNLYSNTSFII